MLARERRGPPLAFQFLAYPAVDDRLETPSAREFTETPMWHRAKCIDMWRMYAGEDRDDLSPFAALTRADDLSGLPPAFVRVAELDPLRDEGISYALCLLQAGVAVELHVVPRTFHGFDQVPSALADAAHIEELAVLRRALGANEARTC